MGNIFVGLGLGLVAMCILWLYGIALTKGWQFAVASILIPFTLLILIGDEQGQKAWGGIGLGVILVAIGGIFIPSIATVRQANVAATESVIFQNSETINQEQAIKGLANLQNYRGSWDVSTTINSNDAFESAVVGEVTVKNIEFTSDGLKVFVDAIISTSEGGTDRIRSALVFCYQNNANYTNNCYWVESAQSNFQELYDMPDKKRFEGYAFFPRKTYLDFKKTPDSEETTSLPIMQRPQEANTIYFLYGYWGDFFNPIKLFAFADFVSR